VPHFCDHNIRLWAEEGGKFNDHVTDYQVLMKVSAGWKVEQFDNQALSRIRIRNSVLSASVCEPSVIGFAIQIQTASGRCQLARTKPLSTDLAGPSVVFKLSPL
jgi:hypothetical protein